MQRVHPLHDAGDAARRGYPRTTRVTDEQQLGDGQRSVVIKLMQEKEQWERERDARADNALDSRFVVQQLPGVPSDDEIAAAVLARGGGLGAIAQQYLPEGISLGTHAIIMDAADRNLHQIFLQERPDLNGVRAILVLDWCTWTDRRCLGVAEQRPARS